jgi:hypothetical protein
MAAGANSDTTLELISYSIPLSAAVSWPQV